MSNIIKNANNNILYRKLLSFFKSEFVVAITSSGLATILQMSIGFVVNKIIAIKLGASGIALLGQFNSFKNLATTAGTGSFGLGVTKYIAGNEVNSEKVIATSNIFAVFSSLIIASIIVFFSGQISNYLFNSIEYKYVLIIFSFSLLGFTLNNLLFAIINGFRKYKLLATVRIINSIVNLIFTSLLTWFYGLDGAFIALSINVLIGYLISVYILRKEGFTYAFNFKRKYFDKKVLFKLFNFTLMALTAAAMVPLIEIYLRTYISDHSSIENAGYWQAIKKFGNYYSQIFKIALSVYYLPKLSSLTSVLQLRKEIFLGYKRIIPFLLISLTIVYLLRNFLLPLLYTKDFLFVSNIVVYQLIGNFFMITSYMIAFLLLAKSMVKTFIVTQLIMAVIRIFLSVHLFDIYNIKGVLMANVFSYIFYNLLIVLIFRKTLFSNKIRE